MNILFTLPLAVFYSLNISFFVDTTNSLQVTCTSASEIAKNLNNNTDTNATCTENYTDPIIIHDADIGIFPGDPDTGKTFIPRSRISTIEMQEDMIVTGIKAADDGKQILIYATEGDIILLPNNLNSSFGNRIEQSSNMIIQRGNVFELTYNATLNKWVITNDNFY